MHLLPSAKWFLAAFHAAVAVAANSGIVEVDLVFPRNDTYAPTAWFPIVFAVRNSSLAQRISPAAILTLRVVTVRQQSCLADESSLANYHVKNVISNNTIRLITFTIKNAAQEVDLVSATNKDDVCLSAQGVAINITDTVEGLLGRQWWGVGDTCAVVASPTPTANPCQIKLDSATAARISASVTAAECRLSNPTIDCPSDDEDKNNAQRLAVGAMSLVAVALGALGFLLI
ncbi:hypothetical protein GCG54_00005156 [Colletotrichum gloeosporioides]|uniref:DUF7136 domain-containing protein n=1 Tax=Colletotrichum gloeosporioides TaxID=474922 RepID=A0A8H4CL57_COLGL|nr:uncharacterized protein GCG54_00005156 [Colletotrichum gloeosporioides]KAF3805792.1 hypothetical protein GCG54_00005156 [Colletotrichum gloeosporioides]